jgi:hypothetical protein
MLSFFAQPAPKTDIMWAGRAYEFELLAGCRSFTGLCMSAVIATEGNCLAEFPQQGSEEISIRSTKTLGIIWVFVMANSRPSTNSDGYGVVGLLVIVINWKSSINGSRGWCGQQILTRYIIPDLSSAKVLLDYSYPLDVLDLAMFQMKNPSQDIAIALCHARNATGVTLGNHPFWLTTMGAPTP